MSTPAITVTVEKLVQGGYGLARHDGQVLFVPGVLPAETVSVLPGARRKGVRETTLAAVQTPSPDRVAAPCPVYAACGGCQLQHIRYEAQLLHKQRMLAETFARLGHLEVHDILPLVPSPISYDYRSAIRFTVFRTADGHALGFYQAGTNQPVAAACCRLIAPPLQTVVGIIQNRLAGQPCLPAKLDALELRRSTASGEILAILHAASATEGQAQTILTLFAGLPSVVGLIVAAGQGRTQRRWIAGQDWIPERLGDLVFRVSDRSFIQANWPLHETVSRTIVEWMRPEPGRRILDLYAGIGALGLTLARHGALVTEVEANRFALADARHAAKANHIGRCRFRQATAEAFLPTVESGNYDGMLLAPPRAGLSEAVGRELLRIGAPRILYLSCDAPTLARDLRRLCAGGYRIVRVQPFDMFPQTAHLETLVELVR